MIALFTVDEETGVRAQDELYGRYVARGTHPGQAETASRSDRAVRTIQAKLFGGIADGCTVALPELVPEIDVHTDGERVHALDSRLAAEQRTPFAVGRYRLVNPTGPEEPIYVAPSL